MAVRFSDLHEGDTLPVLERTPTLEQVKATMGGAFSANTPQQFYDEAYALSIGLPGMIVPAPVKWNFLEQYLRRWLDGGGRIRKLQLSHRRPNAQNVAMIMGGSVVRLYEQTGAPTADFELWIDTPDGDRAVRASATVAF